VRPACARLHVILAREAPLGLVIRHGTAKSVCTLLWNRKNDTFRLGQWMRGRIEIDFCDLSPDGEHFVYRASRYVSGFHTGGVTAWTCVSQTPYLKAMSFYRARYGGWFVDNYTYCAPGAADGEDRETRRLRRVEGDWEKRVSYREQRMVREGWIASGRFDAEFSREAPRGWSLLMAREGKGYFLERDGESLARPDWEWTGVDGARIVFARQGCLFALRFVKGAPAAEKLLHDFNGMKFEQFAAPYETGGLVSEQPASAPERQVRALTKRPRKAKVAKPVRGRVREDE
jgi:hypothetical protein